MDIAPQSLPPGAMLKNLNVSSAKLGPCEICGERTSEMWIGNHLAEYEPGQFTYHEAPMGMKVGHRDCLLARILSSGPVQ